MPSKRTILFLIPIVFVCAVSSAKEPGRLAFNLNDRPDHEIRLFIANYDSAGVPALEVEDKDEARK